MKERGLSFLRLLATPAFFFVIAFTKYTSFIPFALEILMPTAR